MIGFARFVPVQPDGDEGRRLLSDELAKPVYQEAKPTLFDLISQAIGDWLASLFAGAGGAPGAVGLVILVGIVVALVVVAFLVFGRPRLERRGAGPSALFGEHDTRDAAELTRSAEAAARAGDYTTAIAEMFRALARQLQERTLVDVTPGTTAGGFARSASIVFPDSAARLRAASAAFDDVRYLGRSGDADGFERMASLRRDLATARPSTVAVA
ncbi:DUF4129 domain-containing protein [Herbiconiux sp. L3-i23]|uniref:DUF4129 domain-containing protein n=1 Tax=Herbiconiux sp. L3-i23 TaxID=2905871 RepID=UPI002066B5B0|nr:DUF4129 domain-containing protein [Herbiconiux sp. L3-i23]BDI21687.1 hypothetical protein L3i23_04630 [Herbiconiux sp. L3-i23]